MHPGSVIEAVYLCRDPVDFRKSIGGLSALVEQEFGANVFGPSLHVFVSRKRDRIKALYWHRNGFCRQRKSFLYFPKRSSLHRQYSL